jgi:ATP/maltotriose-dependent transcriptional regulator MalT
MANPDMSSPGAHGSPDHDTDEPRTTDEDLADVPPRRFPSVVARAVETDGWPAGADLIERHWDRLAMPAPGILLTAIRSLPGAAFVDRPSLLVGANYLQHLAAGGESSRFSSANVVHAAMSGGDIRLLDTLALLTSRAADARTSGDIEAARDAVLRARGLVDRASEAERMVVRTSLPHMRVQWARSLEEVDDSTAGFEYEEAYEMAILTKQLAIARRAAGQRAWMLASRGRLNAAELWLARAMDAPSASGRYDGIVYLTRALLLLDRDDPEAAAVQLARTEGLGEGEYWAASLWVRSMIARDASTSRIVEARLAHQVERHPGPSSEEGLNGRYIRSSRARLSALRGRPWSAATGSVGQDPSWTPRSSTDRVIDGAVAHGAGRHREAVELLRPATATEEPPRVQSPALLVIAAALLALGRPKDASIAFLQAHALIESERLHTAYECVRGDELSALASLTSVSLPDLRVIHSTHTAADSPLSRREHEILEQLASGTPMSEIATSLFVSPHTVKSTARRLYRKLGVDNRRAAVDAGRAAGLL